MNEDRLQALEALCQKATPGPWIDLARTYFERCKADKKNRGGRWYHGSMRQSSPLVLLVRDDDGYGRRIDPEHIPCCIDKFDLTTIISLFWSSLPRRTTSMGEGFFNPEDAAFIAEARTALPEALAEIRRLTALLDEKSDEHA